MDIDFENADGGVIDYEVANGLQNIGNQYRENGLPVEGMSFADGNDNASMEDDFYGADGDDFYNAGGDEFYDADGDDDDYYNAGGFFARMKERRAEKHEAKMEKRRAKTDIKKARAQKKIASGEAKKTRADAKLGQADAQKLSAQASEGQVAGDVALANALAKSGGGGMSTGAKVGIAVGAVVVLGLVGFLIYKKMKKGK